MAINRGTFWLWAATLMVPAVAVADGAWCPLRWSDGLGRYESWYQVENGVCESVRAAAIDRVYEEPDSTSAVRRLSGGAVLTFAAEFNPNDAAGWFRRNGVQRYRRLNGFERIYVIDSPADISVLLMASRLVADPAVESLKPNWRKALVPK